MIGEALIGYYISAHLFSHIKGCQGHCQRYFEVPTSETKAVDEQLQALKMGFA